MKDLAGALLVGLGGLGFVAGLGGLAVAIAPDDRVGDTGSARAALGATAITTGAISAAMIWGGLSLIRSE